MTLQDAAAIFAAFKTAKADASQTNQQVVTRYNKLYEQERQLRKSGELAKQVADRDAEIARLKALLGPKAGKAAA